MNNYKYEELYNGQEESFSVTIDNTMVDNFRMITGDINPLHIENSEYNIEINGTGSKAIVFGFLTASFISTLAGVYLPGKYSLIHSIDELSFVKPVYVGDTLTITGEVLEKYDDIRMIIVKIRIVNQNNKCVLKCKMKNIVQM